MKYTYYYGETGAPKTPHAQKNRCFPFTVLVYVVQGEYLCTADGALFAVQPGQVLAVPPFVYHDVRMTAAGVLDWAHIAASSQGGELLSHCTVPRVITGEAAARLRDAVVRVNTSAHADGVRRVLRCDAAVAEAYGELLALFWPMCTDSRQDAVIDSVCARAAGQLGRPYTLEQLAQQADMSVSTFSARFRARYGMAPHRYFLELRIKQATYLLLRGTGVAQTAAQLGFYDAYHFSRTFKRRIGCSPPEYVRTHTIGV